ncbi:MAG TPA: class I SAM-dependent methyltransferase [Oscillatoriaceae cyanobacterium M33_DOE_052]|uniref:Class I SAM-dependent methyltransferase n=1 Tax=Planktothricoides sp. SpSt-374 TaxID=2282167 RepID=A0A7C3ZJI3_9CYAN|nr:class I SAM-dependent methyltransferase [Oscillatoriaceae cyanobacterium M33_DOE_052]
MIAHPASADNLSLRREIAKAIAASPRQCLPFSDYMNLVLYHPQHGYYSTNSHKIGAGGDFATSPHLCSDFGEVLAEQFFDMWQILGKPAPFQLLEMGAGQGLIAGDVLTYLQNKYLDFFSVLEYIIVEKSQAMRSFQQHRLAKWGERLRWVDWSEIAPASIIGCVFSNELVDAFPVDLLAINSGKIQEIYVTVAPVAGGSEDVPQFAEVLGELSHPKIAEYFQWLGLDLLNGNYPDGYRSEVNLAALAWMGEVAAKLQRGYVVTIDYGYAAERYYNPSRYQGTLQCYYKHRYHDNPYVNIGHQDITAHVNFTALELQGAACGLEKLGFVPQGLFLMALGLGDRIAALSTTEGIDIITLMQRREVLHGLINPMGLGGFGVLLQAKGLTKSEQTQVLKGLKIPG